jgi:hypothetical protein
VEAAFGADVDYAQLVKLYGVSSDSAKGRYSPAECCGAIKTPIEGRPDPKHISTSYAERANLTMRMHMRRFTRLTNGFSKKIENHAHQVALHFMARPKGPKEFGPLGLVLADLDRPEAHKVSHVIEDWLILPTAACHPLSCLIPSPPWPQSGARAD